MEMTPERFWSNVDKDSGDCWVWMRGKTTAGYGETWDGERVLYTHRFAYELLVGPIPEGLELDHLCRNRACCNPAHLEPVTHAENMRRAPMSGIAAVNAAKTHCVRGHEFNEKNTSYRKRGNRVCLICKREDWARDHPDAAVTNALKTHCKRGHEFTPENTYFPPAGGRKCRACKRLRGQ